jgi:hypothetical protein
VVGPVAVEETAVAGAAVWESIEGFSGLECRSRLPACKAMSTELKSSIDASELSLQEALGSVEERGPVLPLVRPGIPENIDGSRVGAGAVVGTVAVIGPVTGAAISTSAGAAGKGPLGRGPLGRGPLDKGVLGKEPLVSGPLDKGVLGKEPLDRGVLGRGVIICRLGVVVGPVEVSGLDIQSGKGAISDAVAGTSDTGVEACVDDSGIR